MQARLIVFPNLVVPKYILSSIFLFCMLLGAAGIMQYTETNDFELEKLQLVREQSIQLREGIVSNLVLI